MTDKIATPHTETPKRSFSIYGHMLFGTAVMAALIVGIGGWAASAKLSGAAISAGTVVVERHVKKVQHRDGGIVAAIDVRNGDIVKAGDVLLRLDDTQIRAELGIITSQLTEHMARSARLMAERDGLTAIDKPIELNAVGADGDKAFSGELRLFEENGKTRTSQKEQLKLRVEQLEIEISGLEAQRDAKKSELDIIDKEVVQVRGLHKKNLTTVTRVYALEREAKRLGGEHGSLVAQIARAKGQISEINVQLISVDQTARTEAQRELRLIESKSAELNERRIAASDRLKRIELRAPVSGLVHELTVHTVGGVITPAEPVMLIVPESDDLIIEAKFNTSDIDQIAVGGSARIRFPAFAQEKTPELSGSIVNVAADASKDERTGASYFSGRLTIDPGELEKLGELKLMPGMPVEVFVSTGERTALSYLLKPVADQMKHAFRE